MVKKISREDEAELPVFDSHAKAREWFIAKYGDAFVLADSFLVGEDSILYRYDLVLDWKVYVRDRNLLIQGRLKDADALLNSYQSIEIMDTGETHIIH